MTELHAWSVEGIGEVVEGTDLGALLCGLDLLDGDIVLVTSKVVSKAEGRIRRGDREQAVSNETVRVVARRGPRHDLTGVSVDSRRTYPIEGGRVVKKNERDSRRAIAEQLRKEQARKERQRSMLILGACVLVVVALLGSAVFVYVKDMRAEKKAAGTPLADLGVAQSAAGCDPVKKVDASGNGTHITIGKKITYSQSPPAFGPHWPNFLVGSEIRNFYTTQDRPEIERLVHSLEHGHTILWYDAATVKPGTKAYKTVQAISRKFSTEAYFMAAPWATSDGGPFPSGKHIALTHWTGPQKQEGITEFCAAPSGAVVKKFTDTYQPENAPEPGSA